MNCIARHALVHGGKKSSRAQPTCAAAAKKNATEEKVPCFYNYTMGFLSEKIIIFYYPPEAHSGRLLFYRIYRHKYEKVTIFVAKHQITIVVHKNDKKVTIFAPKTGEKM